VRAACQRVSIVLLTALFLSPAAKAQGLPQPQHPQSEAIAGDGSEFFRALLKLKQIKPISEHEDQTLVKFQDVIVVLLGSNRSTHAIERVADAALGGGAILIASDQRLVLNFSEIFKFTIEGSQVNNNSTNDILRNRLQDCPFIVPGAPFGGPGIDPQPEARVIFGGDGNKLRPLNKVAAGTPSLIAFDIFEGQKIMGTPPVVPLARFPAHSFLQREHRTVDASGALFAAGGEWLNTHTTFTNRFVGVASSRAFNNGLLCDKETQNLEWALRVIDFLQGPEQQRNRCLFFENGKLVDHFDDLARMMAKQTQKLPNVNLGGLQTQIVDTGNSFIDRLQTEDVLNNILNRLIPLSVVMWGVFLLAALFSCWFLVRKAFGARKTNVMPPPAVPLASTDPPGIFDRRQKELLRRDNLYEPVRDRIREFFASLGIPGEQTAKLPKLTVSDTVRKPESLRLAIKDLWRLAFGKPETITVARWLDLEPYFERIKQAHADGKWAFAFEAWTDTRFDDGVHDH
jgi:hypothetical protein